MSELVLYTSDDGRTRLDLRIGGQTVWLTQHEIAELFQTTKQNVSLHAKNILKDGELAEDSVVKESLTPAADGKRIQTVVLGDQRAQYGKEIVHALSAQFGWTQPPSCELLQQKLRAAIEISRARLESGAGGEAAVVRKSRTTEAIDSKREGGKA